MVLFYLVVHYSQMCCSNLFTVDICYKKLPSPPNNGQQSLEWHDRDISLPQTPRRHQRRPWLCAFTKTGREHGEWRELTVLVRLYQLGGAAGAVPGGGEAEHRRHVPGELLQVGDVAQVTGAMEVGGDRHHGNNFWWLFWPSQELERIRGKFLRQKLRH